MFPEFTGGAAFYGSSALTASAQVATVARVQAAAWELPHATGIAKKKKKGRVSCFHLRVGQWYYSGANSLGNTAEI